MEQELLKALDGFETVWERVVNSHGAGERQTAPASADETATELKALLRELNGLWEGYRAFARQTVGEAQKRFTAMAEETRESVRALQTEHFLRTGEVYHPAQADRREPGVLTGMRRAYSAEEGLARRFSAAGEQFSPLKEAAMSHAAILQNMIAQLMGR